MLRILRRHTKDQRKSQAREPARKRPGYYHQQRYGHSERNNVGGTMVPGHTVIREGMPEDAHSLLKLIRHGRADHD
jgi:hypothetical protein